MSVRRHVTLLDTLPSLAIATGDWVPLDVRYDHTGDRAITVSVVSGDTVVLEVTTRDEKGIDKSFLTALEDDDIVVFGTYTADAVVTIPSGYTYIRAKKTAGAVGSAKVQGII